MFENTKKQGEINNNPLDNKNEIKSGASSRSAQEKPSNVEDIFAGSEKIKADKNVLTPNKINRSSEAEALQSKKSVEPTSIDTKQTTVDEESDFHNTKNYFIVGIIILAVVLLFGSGYLVYSKFLIQEVGNENLEQEIDEVQEAENKQINNIQAVDTSNAVPEQAPVETIITPKDSDKDGLSDEMELELGTDINSTDTDGDGLFDREEVGVYKTNPLNADTDGDGFTDGDEVEKGYNPKGQGRLFELNDQIILIEN